MDETTTCLALEALHPTQVTLGFEEVELKRRQWRDLAVEDQDLFLSRKRFPAVVGPEGGIYIVDGHHLGRALLEEAVGLVHVERICDLSALPAPQFWSEMDRRGLVYPFDARGHRIAFGGIPRTLGEMTDDPFRTLAAKARRSGCFPKDPTPFAECAWARRLRQCMSLTSLRADPDRALAFATRLMSERQVTPSTGEGRRRS